MIRDSKEVKADLLKALELSCDEQLKKHDFKRRQSSLIYTRNLGEARHTISFDADFFPKYQLDAEIHIHPAMQLSIKSVNDAALSLVGGNKMLLTNAPDIIFNQPINTTAPKEAHTRWFASGFSEISQKTLEIFSFIEKWVIPFFDELQTPSSLVKLHTNNDERILKQRHWYLFVASAEIVQGNNSKALTILENHLGSTGLRKRYSVAFESLGKK
jgi:hypothetical protein